MPYKIINRYVMDYFGINKAEQSTESRKLFAQHKRGSHGLLGAQLN